MTPERLKQVVDDIAIIRSEESSLPAKLRAERKLNSHTLVADLVEVVRVQEKDLLLYEENRLSANNHCAKLDTKIARLLGDLGSLADAVEANAARFYRSDNPPLENNLPGVFTAAAAIDHEKSPLGQLEIALKIARSTLNPTTVVDQMADHAESEEVTGQDLIAVLPDGVEGDPVFSEKQINDILLGKNSGDSPMVNCSTCGRPYAEHDSRDMRAGYRCHLAKRSEPTE